MDQPDMSEGKEVVDDSKFTETAPDETHDTQQQKCVNITTEAGAEIIPDQQCEISSSVPSYLIKESQPKETTVKESENVAITNLPTCSPNPGKDIHSEDSSSNGTVLDEKKGEVEQHEQVKDVLPLSGDEDDYKQVKNGETSEDSNGIKGKSEEISMEHTRTVKDEQKSKLFEEKLDQDSNENETEKTIMEKSEARQDKDEAQLSDEESEPLNNLLTSNCTENDTCNTENSDLTISNGHRESDIKPIPSDSNDETSEREKTSIDHVDETKKEFTEVAAPRGLFTNLALEDESSNMSNISENRCDKNDEEEDMQVDMMESNGEVNKEVEKDVIYPAEVEETRDGMEIGEIYSYL